MFLELLAARTIIPGIGVRERRVDRGDLLGKFLDLALEVAGHAQHVPMRLATRRHRRDLIFARLGHQKT